jgi:parallel beta-helix repeat protein
LFKAIGGNIFQQQSGNSDAGILINGAKRSVAADLQSSYNGAEGVRVKDSPGVRLSNLSAVSNQKSGIWLDNASDATISTATAASNGRYGIWLLGSSRDLITDCNGTSGNGDTGILIGCGAGGQCGGEEKKSDDNRVTNSGAPGNQMAGIVIGKNSRENIVTVTHNDGNPDQHDMVDLNSHCSNNIWYNNTGSPNQSCIH